MGKMNLLQGSFTGSVGKTTGARWKNKTIIRSKIEGRAPPTALQRGYCDHFQVCIKIAAYLLTKIFKEKRVSTQKLTWINEIARVNRSWFGNPNDPSPPWAFSDPLPDPEKWAVLGYDKETEIVSITSYFSEKEVALGISMSWHLFFDHGGNIVDFEQVKMIDSKTSFYSEKITPESDFRWLVSFNYNPDDLKIATNLFIIRFVHDDLYGYGA